MKTKKKSSQRSTESRPTTSNPDRSPGGAAAPPYQGKADEFKLIARTALHPDPDQPRKTFTEASLKELADSIAQQGIVQPLIARLVKAQFKIQEPDLHRDCYLLLKATPGGEIPWTEQDNCDEKNIASLRDAWAGNFGGLGTVMDYQDRYVIVAGERRWRAAEIAGLTELPCIVRDLDAHRVFAQQFIENEQRENITAIEEAEALEREFNRRKALDASFSKEMLAKELGMSRADFYGTLVLTRLHPPVRQALLDGKISTSVAKEVAKVPTPAMQSQLLKVITDEKSWNYPFSVRDVQEMIARDHVKQLDEAPFDTELTYGNSVDGILNACTNCAHRTGNMLAEFPDLKNKPNVCTKPDCFAEKCKYHWLGEADEAKAKGLRVMTTKDFAKIDRDYVSGGDYCGGTSGDYYTPWDKAMGKHKPAPVLVSNESGLQKFYLETEAIAAAKKNGINFPKADPKPKQETAEQKTKRLADEKAEAAVRDRREAFVTDAIPRLGRTLEKLSSAKSWEVAEMLLNSDNASGYLDDDMEKHLVKGVKDPRLVTLGRLFADDGNYPLDYNNEFEQEILDAWKAAGVDLAAEFKEAEKTAQAVLAAPKAKPEQKELLSADARKSIAAAAKKRWAKIKAAKK